MASLKYKKKLHLDHYFTGGAFKTMPQSPKVGRSEGYLNSPSDAKAASITMFNFPSPHAIQQNTSFNNCNNQIKPTQQAEDDQQHSLTSENLARGGNSSNIKGKIVNSYVIY